MAVCLVFIVVAGAIALNRGGESLSQEEIDRLDTAAAAADARDVEEAAAALPPPVSEALALLDQPERPWSMAVVGDSTGNGPDEWVYLIAQQMSDQYDRPVLIHDWSIDTDDYVAETPVGNGRSAQIDIWNGSASGMSAGYSLDNLDAMAPPMRPDLVVINHGHNQSAGAQGAAEIRLLADTLAGRWDSAPAVAFVLQNPRLDDDAERQAETVKDVQALAASYPTALTIDVFAAFEASPDVSALLNEQDQFHPNSAGEQLWAETVATAFGLDQ